MAVNLSRFLAVIKQSIRGGSDSTLQSNWTSTANNAYNATVDGIKDLGGDALIKTADRFNEAMPYIKRAGYDITEIEVGLGLSPKLIAHLLLRELIELEEQQALLDETRDMGLVNTVLASLFRASDARRKLNFKQFQFTHLELELSLLPTITLKFQPSNQLNPTSA